MDLSAKRFIAIYQLTGNESQARATAHDICLEQTVELPDALVTDEQIRAEIYGRIEDFKAIERNVFEARISFAVETVGDELTQLINVVFGNISLKPGIRLERIEMPNEEMKQFRGPRFGRAGLRKYLGVHDRPLLCTALKPMGLSAGELASLAYSLALGGIDLIKDDHGLANQPFAPFRERMARCAEQVERANRETGLNCLYAPNITAPLPDIVERALYAKQNGVGALLICPGIAGIDAMRTVADDDRIALPILSHPAFQGSHVMNPRSGISHYCLFGQLNRLGGADAAIFPNYGGRFSFTKEDCRALVAGTAAEMSHIAPIFPAPAGGMSLGQVAEMRAMYGRDVIFLIGGGLRSYSPDLVANCRYFRRLAETI